jgi:predicted lipid-binding transport protein (Tim44 family)
VFDIYTIIFLALAVFIFLRLRSVLGQRTGRERPPYDPYSTRDAVRSPANDKVVTLPPRPPEAATRQAEPAPPPADRWKGVAESGSSIAAGLDAVVAVDPTFDAGRDVTWPPHNKRQPHAPFVKAALAPPQPARTAYHQCLRTSFACVPQLVLIWPRNH